MAGAVVAGSIADRIGRRLTLLIAGSRLSSPARSSRRSLPTKTILLAGRFVVGVGIGFSSVVAPLYISEVAPSSSRGALVSLYQFAITVGILAAYLIDFALAAAARGAAMLGLARRSVGDPGRGNDRDAGEPALSVQERSRTQRARDELRAHLRRLCGGAATKNGRFTTASRRQERGLRGVSTAGDPAGALHRRLARRAPTESPASTR